MHSPISINGTDFNDSEIRRLISQNFEASQGSLEWFEQRRGLVTASSIDAVVQRDRYNKPYKVYYDYLIEKAIEVVTDKQKRFSNRYMEHGTNNEEAAAAAYEERYGVELVRPEFMKHSDLDAGASLDYLVGDDGFIEIKAPNTDTLIRYAVSMLPPEHPHYELVKMLNLRGNEWQQYYNQIQWQYFISGRKWCDFVVYDPDLENDMQLVVKRVEKNEDYIQNTMVPRVIEFLDARDLLIDFIQNFNHEDTL